MDNSLLENIAAQLRHYTHEETIALVCDFLAGLDEKQRTHFLNLVTQGPHPLVAEAMGLDNIEDLLAEIQELRDDIDAEVYVEYGAGYDAEYGGYRGFGDDSWIDAMDDLFEAATSFFRAGQFEAAADAYIALFDIFELSQDGFKFTRPNPVEALHTDIDAIKVNLFIAIGRGYSEPALEAIEVSGDVRYYGANRYALLDAWEGREDLMIGLEEALIDRARQPVIQGPPVYGLLSHAAELLREFYRRYRTLPDYENLCRQVGPHQGWPYHDLVNLYQAQADWRPVLTWTEDGLDKLPTQSRYRFFLQETRGQALMHLDRHAEALEVLQTLFQEQRTLSVYLKLRQAAQAVDQWAALYPQLTAQLQAQAPAKTGQDSYAVAGLMVAVLLGYAYLLEGDWQAALQLALNPTIPASWGDQDLVSAVAFGLLRMGVVARKGGPDASLEQTLPQIPKMIQEHGTHLELVAHTLPADPLLDGAVQLYQRLVERAIAGKNRAYYAQAAAICKVIQAIRRLQRREPDFERYYRGLFTTYSRYPALKDELRQAIEPSKP